MSSPSLPSKDKVTPWYKQFWPWFLIGLLFSSIIVSTSFAVMSIKSYDGMVVQEDYYEPVSYTHLTLPTIYSV